MGAACGSSEEFCVLSGLVICFSGKIGSGKTAVSELVAQKLGWKRASFGQFVRHLVTQEGGDPTNRKQLQDTGQARESRDVGAFCRDMLDHFEVAQDENLVIDGIRHVSVIDKLTELLHPRSVYLLHLQASATARASRASSRGDKSGDFERASRHTVENDLEDDLPRRADRVLDATAPLEEVVSQCMRALDSLQKQRSVND